MDNISLLKTLHQDGGNPSRDQSELKKELWLRREIANVLRSTSSPEELMYEILAILSRGFGASGASIYFMDREGKNLSLKASYGLSDEYRNRYRQIEVGTNLTGKVAKTGEGMIIHDSQKENGVTPDVVNMLHYRSAMVSPVTSGSEVIGVIALIKEDPNFFSDNDLIMLELLSLHVSILIVNSLLHEDILRERTRMEDILDRVEEGIFEAELPEGIGPGKSPSQDAVSLLEEAMIVLMNPSFGRHAGQKVSLGDPISTAFDRKQVLGILKMALEIGEGNGIERRFVGEVERVFEITMLISTEAGRIKGVKGIRHDVTARARSQRSLMLQKERTELYLDILLNDVGSINKELIGFLEMATTASEISEIQGDYLRSTIEGINKSSEIARKIVAMSKIQEGMPLLKVDDLGKALKDARDIVSMDGAHKNRDIQIEVIPDRMPVKVDDLIVEMFRYIFSFGPVDVLSRIDIRARDYSYDNVEGFLVSIDMSDIIVDRETRESLSRAWSGEGGMVPNDASNLLIAGNIASRYNGKIWIEDLPDHVGIRGARVMLFFPGAY
ncbi:MAG: GAF domain-containing protein [Candidatus Thermoplasmatota archaeon]|nr:GAF domain-containing protein [Candidatus Thermoplasmatota archaeon]